MITVYTKPNCPYCDRAKNYLTSLDIPYETVDITVNNTAKNFLKEQGHRTVPQIYNGSQLLVEGGWSGLVELTEAEIRERAAGLVIQGIEI